MGVEHRDIRVNIKLITAEEVATYWDLKALAALRGTTVKQIFLDLIRREVSNSGKIFNPQTGAEINLHSYLSPEQQRKRTYRRSGRGRGGS